MTGKQEQGGNRQMPLEHRAIIALCDLAEQLLDRVDGYEFVFDKLSEQSGGTLPPPPKFDADGKARELVKQMKEIVKGHYEDTVA